MIELGYPCTTLEVRDGRTKMRVINVEFFEKFGVARGYVFRGLGILVDQEILHEDRHGNFVVPRALLKRMQDTNPWFRDP